MCKSNEWVLDGIKTSNKAVSFTSWISKASWGSETVTLKNVKSKSQFNGDLPCLGP